MKWSNINYFMMDFGFTTFSFEREMGFWWKLCEFYFIFLMSDIELWRIRLCLAIYKTNLDLTNLKHIFRVYMNIQNISCIENKKCIQCMTDIKFPKQLLSLYYMYDISLNEKYWLPLTIIHVLFFNSVKCKYKH